MTENIKREPVTVTRLTCSHPEVKRIWEYGGASMNPTNGTLHRFLCLELLNGEVKEFKDDGEGQAETDAEKFLSELPEKTF